MSTPFQNRLVGTVIVAAIVIIFLPDVLNGEKKTHQTDFEEIPNAPVFSGKLSNKTFPEDRLTQQPIEAIIDEKAQDDLLEIASDTNVVKITPKKKTILPENIGGLDKTSNNVDSSKAKNSSENKKVFTALPEKTTAKKAWVIHLGSFKHKQNVAQLLAKLKNNGYTVFTQPIETKQGTLTKVFIGPELVKSSLEKKLSALKVLTNTQGKVAPFYPTK